MLEQIWDQLRATKQVLAQAGSGAQLVDLFNPDNRVASGALTKAVTAALGGQPDVIVERADPLLDGVADLVRQGDQARLSLDVRPQVSPRDADKALGVVAFDLAAVVIDLKSQALRFDPRGRAKLKWLARGDLIG